MRRSAPRDSPRTVAQSVILALFFAAALGGLSFGLWVADQVVLRLVYGSDQVEQLGLRIVAIKPDLKVSNGDTLEEWSFRHWGISAIVWRPSTVGLFFGLRRLMPADYRGLADLQQSREDLSELPVWLPAGCLLLLLALVLVFVVAGMAAGSALLAATALSVAWVASWLGGRSTTQ